MYMRGERHLKEGNIVTNIALGNTLEAIANTGNADIFYDGFFSSIIAKDIQNQDGVLTKSDLKKYKAVLREPLMTRLGDYTILTSPPPASGPVLAYILNILKGKLHLC